MNNELRKCMVLIDPTPDPPNPKAGRIILVEPKNEKGGLLYGTVISVGSAVEDLKEGDKVIYVAPYIMLGVQRIVREDQVWMKVNNL